MIVTVHQPEHLPWLGFFHKAAQADLLVLLDNVQYRHKYFQNRNRIRTATGTCWLTVPVALKGQGRPLIHRVRIDPANRRWREKCWRSISLTYRRARFFDTHAPFFEETYARPWDRLVDLNEHLLRYLFQALGIRTSLMRASALQASGAGPELIANIAKTAGATRYLSGISGIAGRGRELEALFAQRGIEVSYQEFHHPIYRQLYEPFIPCVSVVDLLLTHGPDSLAIIQGVGVETLEMVFP